MKTRACLPVVGMSSGNVVRGYARGLDGRAIKLIKLNTSMLTIQEFELTLPYMVSGKNSVKITRYGKRYPTKRFDIWRGEVICQIEKQCGVSSLANRFLVLRCDIRYWPNDKRTRDVPGMEDALYHCLERAGIIANDGQIKHSSFTTETVQDEVKVIVSLRVCP